MTEEKNVLEKQMLENLQKMKQLNIEPYKYNFKFTHTVKDIRDNAEQLLEKVNMKVAGRIMSKRRHGKVMFLDIKDKLDKIQLYVRKDEVGEDKYEMAKLLDIGDIIGVQGLLFKTKTEELTIKCSDIDILSKALKPLPEKYHGLKDKEIRFRKRYLDLIMNDDSKKIFIKRAEIIDKMREILKKHNFIEVETPVLQPVYGGAFAEPFKTHLNALDMTLYLRIADELYLKRLIIGGMNRVFEFAKDFRNEGVDKTHNPEFTQLEFYQAYADYYDMMNLVEEIFEAIVPEKTIEYQGKTLDFSRPWKRIDFFESIKEKTGFNVKDKSIDELKDIAKQLNIDIENKKTYGKIIDEIFSEKVQGSIVNPTFVMNQPFEISPLAKKHRERDGVVERFEPIIAGMEIGNAYSELNDPIDQQERFEKQVEERLKGDTEAFEMDNDFIEAIKYGMPPTGGVGLGIDRIIMLLTNSASIKDVILFPLYKRDK